MLSQEIETYYLLPAIRRELVVMMQKKGLSQKEVAEKLHLTKSAVSQYVSGKRGKEFILDKKYIKDCCENIISGENYLKEIQNAILNLKKTKEICQIYSMNNLKPEDCEVC